MTGTPALLDIGVGARAVLSRPAPGRVLAVYAAAAYLQVPTGLLALTTAQAPRGPLHVRGTALPPLRPGDVVTTDGTELCAGGLRMKLDAPTWRGKLPSPALLKAHAQVAVRATRDIRGSQLLRNPLLAEPRLADVLRVGDVAALARVLGGRGPGLTPSGDDLLAGVLLTARALWGERAEPRLVAAAAAVQTTRIAEAFLGWAARGQLIEPAHRFLLAVAAGDPAAARAAALALLPFGHSSGRDLISGVCLGLRHLPATGP